MTNQPNILIVISDQHSRRWSSPYGHQFIQTPNMQRLSDDGVTFDCAYTNSPICVPARASFMTGKHVSNIGVWDNGTPLSSDEPTWAHLLNAAGYETTLCGKMHFQGQDQHHGFTKRILDDVHGTHSSKLNAYWADPDPSRRGAGRDFFEEVGPGDHYYSDYDEEAAKRASTYLSEPERNSQPWALVVGFITPHNPFICRQPYWDMYYPEHADLPTNPAHHDTLHPRNQRMAEWFDTVDLTDDQIRRCRAAYYGLCSYTDDQLGVVLDALDDNGLTEDTIVIYTSDHGEANGEHGMWHKQSFYEDSCAIPFIVKGPGVSGNGRRSAEPISLVDLSRTLLELGNASIPDGIDGKDLTPLLGGAQDDPNAHAISEYFAVGANASSRMLRQGDWKLIFHHNEAPELFNLKEDPEERNDLSSTTTHQDTLNKLMEILLQGFDADEIHAQILDSQQKRRIIEIGDPGHHSPPPVVGFQNSTSSDPNL